MYFPEESNRYGLGVLPDRHALVADAAGNDIIRALPGRDVTTMARFDLVAMVGFHQHQRADAVGILCGMERRKVMAAGETGLQHYRRPFRAAAMDKERPTPEPNQRAGSERVGRDGRGRWHLVGRGVRAAIDAALPACVVGRQQRTAASTSFSSCTAPALGADFAGTPAGVRGTGGARVGGAPEDSFRAPRTAHA
jgi:hypothetical protein